MTQNNIIKSNNEDRLPLVEEFYSIQGEGYHSGRAAYFIRLGGCDVRCRWCDAKESWNEAKHPMVEINEIVARAAECGAQTAVITGGEPLMHDLSLLCHALHKSGIKVHIETSGSRPLSGELDWVCVSPKEHKPPIGEMLLRADELKVVIGSEVDLERAEACAKGCKESCMLYLQPEWSVSAQIMPTLVDYAKVNPQWQISIQTHKYMQIP